MWLDVSKARFHTEPEIGLFSGSLGATAVQVFSNCVEQELSFARLRARPLSAKSLILYSPERRVGRPAHHLRHVQGGSASKRLDLDS